MTRREQMKSHFVVHTNGQDEWIKVDKRIYDKAIDMFCAAYEAELKAKENHITELTALIQKMKCCGNCDNREWDGGMGTCCKFEDLRCEGLSHWELKKI